MGLARNLATEGDLPTTIANATAVNQNATAVNQNATAVNQAASIPVHEHMGLLTGAGQAYHATVAGGGALNVNAGFAEPFYPARTVQIVLGVGGANPVNYTVRGENMVGQPVEETIVAAGAGTYQGVIAFRAVTEVLSDVDPVGDTDIQTGEGYGLAVCPVESVIRTAADGQNEPASTVNLTTGTVIPTTAPDGATSFDVLYTLAHNHQQDAHTHTQNAHTHTQNAHTHGLS